MMRMRLIFSFAGFLLLFACAQTVEIKTENADAAMEEDLTAKTSERCSSGNGVSDDGIGGTGCPVID